MRFAPRYLVSCVALLLGLGLGPAARATGPYKGVLTFKMGQVRTLGLKVKLAEPHESAVMVDDEKILKVTLLTVRGNPTGVQLTPLRPGHTVMRVRDASGELSSVFAVHVLPVGNSLGELGPDLSYDPERGAIEQVIILREGEQREIDTAFALAPNGAHGVGHIDVVAVEVVRSDREAGRGRIRITARNHGVSNLQIRDPGGRIRAILDVVVNRRDVGSKGR